MPRTRPAYPEAYRRQIVELARNGRSIAELAREFEPSEQTIRGWLKQAEVDDAIRSDGVATSESDELRRLRRELRAVKQERDILAKAAAWFGRLETATETGAEPGNSSDS